jgi:HPt (histidine-containing phosphotransfer) domain-containing protein
VSDDLFNSKVLDEWLEHNPQLITKFIDLTLKGTETLGVDIKEAFADRDFIKLNRSFHSLKSTAAQIGGLELSSICKSLEKVASSENIEEIEKSLEFFDLSYVEFIKEIKCFREKHNV